MVVKSLQLMCALLLIDSGIVASDISSNAKVFLKSLESTYSDSKYILVFYNHSNTDFVENFKEILDIFECSKIIYNSAAKIDYQMEYFERFYMELKLLKIANEYSLMKYMFDAHYLAIVLGDVEFSIIYDILRFQESAKIVILYNRNVDLNLKIYSDNGFLNVIGVDVESFQNSYQYFEKFPIFQEYSKTVGNISEVFFNKLENIRGHTINIYCEFEVPSCMYAYSEKEKKVKYTGFRLRYSETSFGEYMANTILLSMNRMNLTLIAHSNLSQQFRGLRT